MGQHVVAVWLIYICYKYNVFKTPLKTKTYKLTCFMIHILNIIYTLSAYAHQYDRLWYELTMSILNAIEVLQYIKKTLFIQLE